MSGMQIQGLTDTHCPLLPYVDDGAENLKESHALLTRQWEQGVETVFLTVHLRRKMFETPQEEVEKQFYRLKEEFAGEEIPELYLGRENHCDRLFLRCLEENQVQTLGGSPYVLIEFHDHSSDDIRFFVHEVKKRGMLPVIAHFERYPAIHAHPELVDELVDQGVWLQMNTEGILGEEGRKMKKFCWTMLKEEKVKLVASDAHHMGFREPNLGKCAELLQKKLPGELCREILFRNPEQIIESIR